MSKLEQHPISSNFNQELNLSPAEVGFTAHEQGPNLQVESLSLPYAYREGASGELSSQYMVTDQGNPVIITSLIGQSPSIAKIASKIEDGKGQNHYSEDVQRLFLLGVKNFADEKGLGVKTVNNAPEDGAIYYNGNTGTSNGRLLRVYFATVGQRDGVPVVAKIGACRTKESETKLLKKLGVKVPGKL